MFDVCVYMHVLFDVCVYMHVLFDVCVYMHVLFDVCVGVLLWTCLRKGLWRKKMCLMFVCACMFCLMFV